MVASAAGDRTIRFWQPTIGRVVRYVRLESAPLDIAWLNDESHSAAACVDGHVRIIDADTVEVRMDLPALDACPTRWPYIRPTAVSWWADPMDKFEESLSMCHS